MPLTSSAKKANRRSKILQERNLTFKIAMKRAIKDLKKAAVAGEKKEDLTVLVQSAYSAIDKAQKRNILHKNAAARKKSRLTKMALAA